MSIPKIDYSVKDYVSIRSELIKRIPELTSKWTDFNADDVGITLIELFAYIGDILNEYADRLANESYLSTAQSRQSVSELVKMLGYTLQPMTASVVKLEIKSSVADVGDNLEEGFIVKTESGLEYVTYNIGQFKYKPPYYNSIEYDISNNLGKDIWSDEWEAMVITANNEQDIAIVSSPYSVSSSVYGINIKNGDEGDLYTIEHNGPDGWRTYCYTEESFTGTTPTGSVTKTKEGNILYDANASFEEFHKNCYITKTGFAYDGTYEGKILEIIDENTIRTSFDTRDGESGYANWEVGDDYEIKVIPARLYRVGGRDYLEIVSTLKDGNGDFYPLIIEDTSPGIYDTSIEGIGLKPTSHTESQYKAVDVYAINVTKKESEVLGSSTGKAYQRFRLGMNDLSYHLPFSNIQEGYDIEVEVDEGEGYQEWFLQDNFIDSGYVDRHFLVQVTESGKSFVIFGDNTRGKIPNINATVRATYKYGGGTEGNVDAYSISELVSEMANGDSEATVRN